MFVSSAECSISRANIYGVEEVFVQHDIYPYISIYIYMYIYIYKHICIYFEMSLLWDKEEYINQGIMVKKYMKTSKALTLAS